MPCATRSQPVSICVARRWHHESEGALPVQAQQGAVLYVPSSLLSGQGFRYMKSRLLDASCRQQIIC